MQLDKKYMTFYLDGRGDDLLDDEDIDVDELVEKALEGGDDPRKISMGVAENLAAPLRHDRDKREWISDNKAAIKEAGGSEQLAFDHYVQGRIDQYALALEEELVTGMFEEDSDEDEDEGEDDED